MIKRVIPQLLINQKKLVKTRNFQPYKYVGDPINAIKIFNEKEVDELFITDITKGLQSNAIDFNYIQKLAEEAFMPISYGGGINSLEDASQLINIGVEKLCIHSQTFQNINLIGEIAAKFGNQAVVANINIRLDEGKKPSIYDASSGKFYTELSLQAHANNLVNAGAGEIFLNDTNRDGMLSGLNHKALKELRMHCNVPIIISGGCSGFEDIKTAFMNQANAVAVGAYFVFYGPYDAVLISYPDRELIDRVALND
jgi:imidazole glycerol-phosphate synthase subunit HisF